MKELKVIFTKGLPASGKTTWAKEFVKDSHNFKRVNKDELRLMLDNGKYSPENEKNIDNVFNKILIVLINNKSNIICDNTNLCESKLNKTISELDSFVSLRNYGKHEDDKIKLLIEIKDFRDVSFEECIKRDFERKNPVGAEVIFGMYEKYIMPKKYEAVKID